MSILLPFGKVFVGLENFTVLVRADKEKKRGARGKRVSSLIWVTKILTLKTHIKEGKMIYFTRGDAAASS